MAYKFQLGNAILSGSLTQEGQILAKDSKISGSSIAITDVSGIVETGGGIADSGDGTLELEMVTDGIDASDFNLNGDTLYIGSQANGGNIRSGSIADMVSRMTGSALAASNGVLSVSNLANAQVASNAAIDFSKLAALSGGNFLVGNASNVATSVAMSGDASLGNNGAITLTGSQTNITSIFNSGFTAIGTANNQEYIDFSNSNEIKLAINNSAMLSVTATGIEIAGNLTVEGSTTTIDSTTINVTGGLSFEGSTNDGFETTLNVIDPSADRTISLPDLSADATLAAFSDASFSAANITPSPITLTELNLLDGGSTVVSASVVDGDAVLFNDGGVMKHLRVQDIKSYVESGFTPAVDVNLRANGNTLATGINYFGNITTNISASLPGTISTGQSIRIKAGDMNDGNSIQINRNGTQTIDGETSISLESPFAAVELVCVSGSNANALFRVF